MTLPELLIKYEGMELKPYRCPSGQLTIGCGRNIQDLGISEGEAMLLLQNDITRCRNEAMRVFPWYLNLDPVRRDAFIALLFQLGLPRFMGFAKMLAALKRGDFEEAARQALDSKWARQVPERAKEMAEMIRVGAYPP
jgi:lysozyme